jgi:hypothetical protein
MNIDESLSEKGQVERDIKRSIILSKYIQYWGIPEYRTIANKEKDKFSIEIYYFPPAHDEDIVCRLATVGISDSILKNTGKKVSYELMMILPPDLGNAKPDEVVSYFLSIIVSSLNLNEEIRESFIFPETNISPKEWKTRALLIDTPRWESEELDRFQIGMQSINLYLIIPIHTNEYNLIKTNGIEAFDILCEAAELSVIGISRDSFV